MSDQKEDDRKFEVFHNRCLILFNNLHKRIRKGHPSVGRTDVMAVSNYGLEPISCATVGGIPNAAPAVMLAFR